MTFLFLLPTFKPVSLSLSRISFYSKTPQTSLFFNPYKLYLTSFTQTSIYCFFNYTFFSFNVKIFIYYSTAEGWALKEATSSVPTYFSITIRDRFQNLRYEPGHNVDAVTCDIRPAVHNPTTTPEQTSANATVLGK